MKRVLIEHIPSGKKWESDWVESDKVVLSDFLWDEYADTYAISFPYGGRNISIPPAILNECVRTYEYGEE